MNVLTETPSETAASAMQTGPSGLRSYFSRLAGGQPTPWNKATLAGLAALIVIWAAWFYGTWGAWGNLTIDCGREIYVPTVLAEGKTLYRDIWYLYGPLAPYWNSLLFRVFGVHLAVLYWAGSLSALGCALLLYHVGMKLSAALAGWTAAAAVLIQAFSPTLFSFPLPYSFATVYGYLVSCTFLWILVHVAISGKRSWVFAAGTAAAAALLLKLEIGVTCYIALALFLATRVFQQRSWKAFLKDAVVCLPGVLACVAVILWMISLRGVEFLTQENLMSWPSSYFMRTLGKAWLVHTGFAITAPALGEAAKRTLVFLALLQGLHLFVSRKHQARNILILRAALFVLGLVYILAYLTWFDAWSAIFFPKDMVLYVSIAAFFSWYYFLRRPEFPTGLAVTLLLTFSGLFAFRILLLMMAEQYSVFYNGLPILCFLILMHALLARSGRSEGFVLSAEAAICLACLVVPVVQARRSIEEFPRPAWLVTERGSVRVSAVRAQTYGAAIQFLRQKHAQGETVLSVPEDTSLYFLSATHCPSRVFAFTPGLVAPGKMTSELIDEIKRSNVRYLLWSNRIFQDGGGMRFGVDFDQAFGNYLTSHYHRVGPVWPSQVPFGEWTAFIWERNAETPSGRSLLSTDTPAQASPSQGQLLF
jgi:hypothetical protein